MDTTTHHGELLFNLFGSLAQYERALTKERILAGLRAAKRRGRIGERPKIITDFVIAEIKGRLANGETKSAICVSMKLKRSTFYGGIKQRLHSSQ
jgi:DNA invertase Pin-like site-specific DNA recombinase